MGGMVSSPLEGESVCSTDTISSLVLSAQRCSIQSPRSVIHSHSTRGRRGDQCVALGPNLFRRIKHFTLDQQERSV